MACYADQRDRADHTPAKLSLIYSFYFAKILSSYPYSVTATSPGYPVIYKESRPCPRSACNIETLSTMLQTEGYCYRYFVKADESEGDTGRTALAEHLGTMSGMFYISLRTVLLIIPSAAPISVCSDYS